ncbi:hypothetical protein NQZ68_015923 [Dissostichus eleginoides]|nr:hypothetical protein NQZ68_015923 [Dissostichus eleginoides]
MGRTRMPVQKSEPPDRNSDQLFIKNRARTVPLRLLVDLTAPLNQVSYTLCTWL